MSDSPHEPPSADDAANPPPRLRPVRPRDAATLILVRRDQGTPSVLMGRRNRGHSFMPDKWVFPGGAVDRSDARAPFATDLDPAVAERLRRTATASRARALAMAAVRETFEEAGLLLARSEKPRLVAGPWRDFFANGAAPDLAALDFIARAITPPSRNKRFDARFFMADATRLMSLERLSDCGELDEIAWFTLDEAMALDLAYVTRVVLRDLALRLDDPTRPAPFSRTVRGVRRMDYV
jgi:8-oxo-dGTP pyrophosphatase MutT (NUDIX family)